MSNNRTTNKPILQKMSTSGQTIPNKNDGGKTTPKVDQTKVPHPTKKTNRTPASCPITPKISRISATQGSGSKRASRGKPQQAGRRSPSIGTRPKRSFEQKNKRPPIARTNKQLNRMKATLPIDTSNCVERIDGKTQLNFNKLEQADFYHGFLPRADTEQLLKADGDFVVRTTQSAEDRDKQMAISVRWAGKSSHIIPSETSRGVNINNDTYFPDLSQLLKFHFNNHRPLNVLNQHILLLNPIPKADWELQRSRVQLQQQSLGKGEFGEVRAGLLLSIKSKATMQEVAVKVCNTNTITKQQLTEFMAEARLMRTYEHPNVVKFLGVVVESEPIMIVMELVRGGSLDKLLKRLGDKTTLDDRLKYCRDAAKGLEYLHHMNCIHRDIAARNCLIDRGIVKISDFGQCRQLKESNDVVKESGKISLRWQAPEVVKDRSTSFHSDVWSFGVLMWEIYSNGALPYPELETNKDVLDRLIGGEHYRMAHPEKMPKPMRQLLDQCWTQTPEQRPPFKTIVALLNKH